MKTFLPVIIAALALASCSTAYKSGQTPDDVYYSPQRPAAQRIQESQDEYVRMDRNQGGRSSRYNEEENYDDYYLRMKVRNRDRWAMLDNDLYFNNYSPYGYNSYGYNPYLMSNPYAFQYFGNPFNNYFGGFGGLYNYGFPAYSNFGSYYNPYNPYGYNPYGHQVIVVTPRGPAYNSIYNKPRTSNLNIYNNSQSNNAPRQRTRVYNNTNNDSYYDINAGSRSRNSGSDLRNVFGNNSSNNSNQNSTPSRSYSSPSPSSGSSSGGNAPVRRF